MWLDRKAVLHVVETATRSNAATFLYSHGEIYGQSVDEIWSTFIKTWVKMYTDYRNRLRLGQASVFTYDIWRYLANVIGIQLSLSGVKAHSSLRVGERIHSTQRRIYEK